ncbi:MAG: DedA family protein [Phycisphaerales bacterium]|nr:DedA family protein [Phycisphaerales bacterium]
MPVEPFAHAGPIGRWSIHRRLYNWMLGFGHSRYGTLALFVFSFTESIFFPLPPDILQIPMTLERRDRAWYYATVSTVASVLGGITGYAIGYLLWDLINRLLHVPEQSIEQLRTITGNFWTMLFGTVIFHPYKIFTVGSGMLHASLPLFIVASIIGRGSRFFLIALLLRTYGAPVRVFIEKYFNLLTIVLTVLVVLGIVAIKFL